MRCLALLCMHVRKSDVSQSCLTISLRLSHSVVLKMGHLTLVAFLTGKQNRNAENDIKDKVHIKSIEFIFYHPCFSYSAVQPFCGSRSK